MKRSLFTNLRAVALVATGVFLGRGAQADTILDFELPFPAGQAHNAAILQSFGDNVSASSDGITVSGFGTPNIGLTWQATGAGTTRWDYYNDFTSFNVWQGAQLNNSRVGDRHELVFTPNSPLAAVVVKSFNFHPYYISNERFTYSVSVLAGATVVSGPTSFTFLSDSTKNHPVSINYTGSIGQTLTLRLSRVASTLGGGEVEGDPADIAVDDITFAQSPETEFSTGPQVLTVSPANNQTSVAPDYLYSATITNGTTTLNTNSIQLRHNLAGLVSPTIVSNAGLTTVSYAAVGLLPPGSTNNYTLTFNDTGAPVKSYTNVVQYVVADYVDVKLPAPIASAFENFNSTAEGALPAGWTGVNLDGQRDPTSEPNITLTNLDSAAYTNWTVVDVSRFAGAFDVYSTYYNGGTPDPAWTTDYQRVLGVNPSNVVNGVFLRNLATGRLAFGNSGYRNDALGQIVYLFSPDFNCTGQANVYLAFRSLWEQNQDSIAAIEYSVDQGATWLPIAYYLDGPDVATNLDGSIDALTTFTNVQPSGFQGAATYINPNTLLVEGGYYGAFIGVASNLWSTLAPYISRRVDDNPTESKRVQIYRLPQADNQATVRLRFAHAGTDSWYFGIDDLGLYSLAPLQITSIVRNGGNAVISWNGAAGTKLQKATTLTNPNWQDVPGTNGASSANDPIAGEAYYRLVRPY